MIKLSSLKNSRSGRPCAVLGGGYSLLSDRKTILQGSLTIAVNHHALVIGMSADIIVYMDKPHKFTELQSALESFDGLKFSPKSGEVDFDVKIWDGGFSSTVATWLACYMGCDPVILCGMDCYQGEKIYCHDTEVRPSALDNPLENHLNAWRDALKYCQNPERIRAASGPLVEIFGEFNVEN